MINTPKKRLLQGMLLFAGLAISSSAHAALTDFANIFNADLSFNNTGLATSNFGTPSDAMGFQFVTGYEPAGVAPLTTIPATIVFNSVVNGTAGSLGTLRAQAMQSITMSIVAASTVGSVTVGSNLLTMTASGGTMSGNNNAATAGFSGDVPGGFAVSFTSAYLNFPLSINRSFSLSLNAIAPGISIGAGGFFSSFTSTVGGSFASDPPAVRVTGAPEPTTLALLALGGFGSAIIARRRLLS
jgi:hypothetical protein